MVDPIAVHRLEFSSLGVFMCVCVCVCILVPWIEVAGQPDSAVYFPSWSTSGDFEVSVYATSSVVDLQISRSDGREKTAEFLIKQWHQEPYSIRNQYRIHVPWIDTSITGTYTIRATDEDKSVELTIQIYKVQREQAFVCIYLLYNYIAIFV